MRDLTIPDAAVEAAAQTMGRTPTFDEMYAFLLGWQHGTTRVAERDADVWKGIANGKQCVIHQLELDNARLRALLGRWVACPEVTEIDPKDRDPDTDQVWRETRAALEPPA